MEAEVGGTTTKERRKTTRFLIQRVARFVAADSTGAVASRWLADVPDFGVAAVGWVDVGEVEVPSGTHRKTAVQQALSQFEIDHGELPAVFRVLDMDAAEPIPVRLDTPPAPAPRVTVG